MLPRFLRPAHLGKLRHRLGFAVRRAARASYGFVTVAVFMYLLWSGYFPDLRRPGADLGRMAAAAALTAVLAAKVAGRVRVGRGRRSELREALSEAELGLLLLTTAYLLLQITGGALSPFQPLIYGLVSYLVTFHRLFVGLPLAAATVGFEALISFGPGAAHGAAATFPGHAGFVAVFALSNVTFLHAEVLRQRWQLRRRIEDETARMRDDARAFRLSTAALPAQSRVRSRAEEETRLAQGGVETIHRQLLGTLDLLRRSMDLQTCALLWLDDAGDKLMFKELASDAPHVGEGPINAGAGVFGAVIKGGHTINLRDPKPALLPYYDGPAEVSAFVGVPVVEGVTVRGILVADRRGGRAFDEREAALVEACAQQVLLILQAERVFQAVERSKHEHERFYAASVALNRAVKLADVYDAAVEGARGVTDFDFAAIATFDAARGSHTIRRAVGEWSEGLEDKTWKDPESVASMVVKTKQALPSPGGRRDHDIPVFGQPVRLRDFESLLVLPLRVGDDVIGTFTVAARRSGAFPTDRRQMLEVIANQVAVSMQNGRMVQKLEEQATTDGMTRLTNRQTFDGRFAEMLERASRFKRPVSILLTDFDHFKKVNDTYGHQTGDEVLKRLAAILKASARNVDIVARLGGEEFAIVLEDQDRERARLLAERVRIEVARQSFSSSKGAFKGTISLGIATYPEDAREKDTLVSAADQALYAAKHGGRNRTVCFTEIARASGGKIKAAV